MKRQASLGRRLTTICGRWGLLLCTLVLGVSAVWTSSPGSVSAAGIGTLQLSPNSVASGQSISGTACSFETGLTSLQVTVTNGTYTVQSYTEPATASYYGSGCYTVSLPTTGLNIGYYTVTVSSVYGTSASAQFSVSSTGGTSTGTLQLSPSSVAAGQAVTGTACGFTAGLSSFQVSISNGSLTMQTYTEPASASYYGSGCYTVSVPTSALSTGYYTVTVSSGYGMTATAQLSVTTTGTGSTGTLQLSPSTVTGGQAVTGTACGLTNFLTSLQVAISNGSYTVQSYTEPATASYYGSGCYTVSIPTSGLTTGYYTVTVTTGYGMSATAQLYISSTGSTSTGTLQLSPSTATAGQSVTGSACGFTAGFTSLQVALSNGSTVVQSYTEPATASYYGSGCYTVPVPTSALSTGYYTVTVSNGIGTTATAQLYVTTSSTGGLTGTLQLSPSTVAAGQAVTGTACGFTILLSSMSVAISNGSYTVQSYTEPAAASYYGSGCYTISIPTSGLSTGYYTVTVSSGIGTTASAQLYVSSTGSISTGTLQLSPTTATTGQAVTGSACGFTAGLTSLQVAISNGSTVVQSYTEPASASYYGSGCYTVPVPTSALSIGYYTVTVSSAYGMTATAQLSVNTTGTGVANTLTFTSGSAVPGSLVTANGCGFSPSDSLSLLVSTSGSEVGATSVTLVGSPMLTATGTNGTYCYNVQFYVPSGLAASGVYYVYLIGSVSGTVDSGTLGISSIGVGTLTASPTSATPGTVVSLTGVNFAANATVTISAFGTSQTVFSAAGTFSATLTVPAGTAAGTYTVTALDSTGRSGSATITVPTSGGTLQVSSTSAVPGQVVTVTGSGFSAGEAVSISLSYQATPTSAIAGTTEQFIAPTGGAFSAQYTVPGVTAGSYYLLAQGTSSGASATAAFTVIPTTPTATVTPIPPAATATPTTVPTTSAVPLPSVSSASTTRYFAAGYTGTVAGNGKVAFSEHLYFYNPSTTSSTVTTTYAVYNSTAGTTSNVSETNTVAPGATVSRSVNSDVGSDKMVSATVNASSGIVAEEVIQRTAASGAVLDSASSLGSSSLGTTWYMAEGYTGSTFQEYLTIYNPGSTAAQVQVQYLPNDTAAPQPVAQTVPAGGQATINVRSQYNGLEPVGSKNIAIQVTSDVPVAVDREMYWGDGTGSAKYGASLSPAVASGTNTQYFSLLPTSGGSQSFITVLNPGTSAAGVTLTLRNAGGSTVQTVSATVNAQRRYTFTIPSIAPGNNGYLSATLTSTLPVVSEVSVYLGGSPNIGLHPGTVEQGSSGFQVGSLAEVDSAGGTLQVFNPGTSSARVQVLVGGTVLSDTTLQPGAAQTVAFSPKSNAQGVLVLASSAVSATLLNGGLSSAPVWGGSLG